MKITLIMPQSDIYKRKGIFKKSLRYAPLTLSTLAALVPKKLNAEVRIIDEGTEDLVIDEIDADIVGITCITGTSHRVYEISKELRSKNITVVIGGVHPTLVPDEVQKHADSVVVGYAEYTWPQLLIDFSRGNLKKRYTQGKEFKFENMPEPRRDLLKSSGYLTMNTVQATRGCPYKCEFCVVPITWPGYYHRPVKEVIAEIEKFEGDTFLFVDLSPMENGPYIKELFRALIPLKKKWGGLSTINIAKDKEKLDLAMKSGCKGLLIGYESVSQKTVSNIGKVFNKPSDYMEWTKIIHDHGIAINGCFVLGLDGDDKSIFQETLDFVEKAAIDLPRFSVPTPFPGTPYFNRLKNADRILHTDWKYYDTQHVVIKPENMTPEELQEGLLWTWKNSYSFRSMFKRIKSSKATKDFDVLKLAGAANFGYRFYSRLLPKHVPVPCESEPWIEK